MDGADVNGGNAEVARDDPNLENVGVPDSQEESLDASSESPKMDEQEVNGDLKGTIKKGSPGVRRKLRKFKANSTSTIESDKPKTRGRKRKLSEPDDASSEGSAEFNGFDAQGTEDLEPGNHVLKKLIAEAESAEPPQVKRRGRPPTKHLGTDLIDPLKIKKEKESDKSETESIGIPNSLESEAEPHKSEDSTKSANSSANSSPSAGSQRSKGSRFSRGASPGSGTKQKVPVDMTNPAFKEPFKYGWRRELVFRAGSESSVKRMADIYYYTPKGKKVRSFREVAEFLNTKELTIDNFTFFKEPTGVNDPEKEVIRDAKRGRDSGPVTPKLIKKGTPGRKPGRKPAVPVEDPPIPQPTKATPKSPKMSPAGFKVKLPGKRGAPRKIKSPPKEVETPPPQWTSPAATRRSQQPVEKTPIVKPKRNLKAKVQEPCSIRCSTSMGLIPSLQCCLCLCLYHPECVDGVKSAGNEDYVCKNCQPDTDETLQQHQSVGGQSLTPPPLIPISMLGAQNSKPKHQVNLTPPKLQRIPKSEATEQQTRNVSKASKAVAVPNTATATEKKEGSWFPQGGNEFLHSHDGSVPKPAQNIALMAGKKYIVVPKNNAMAVQPAITVKPEKIGDKPPVLQETPIPDASNLAENSIISHVSDSESINLDQSDNKNSIQDIAYPAIVTPSVLVSESEESTENYLKTEPVDVNDSITSEPINLLSNTDEPKTAETKKVESPVTVSPAVDEQDVPVLAETVDDRLSPTPTYDPSQIIQSIVKKRQMIQAETDQRQHFMFSVCAGYHALSRIFQYLKVQELLRAARVCKMWRDLAAHPSLWKTVRMKNSQVTDWDGFADSLKRRGTQHLDLRKMLVAGESDGIWRKFVTVIPRVTSLVKLELCRCPVMVVEEVIKSCPQLEVLSAMSIKCDTLNLESVGNLKRCQELRLKATSGMSLQGDLTPLQDLTCLTHLSLTSVKELGKKKIEILQMLTNLETLELGECSDFPDKFGTSILIKLPKLERLRLEKGQGTCCTFDILEGVSKLENLNQLELVNFDVKNGFDKCLANCKNIKRLLIIPTYISQSATSNNMVLGGVTELSNNLTHFVWGVTLELLRVTELFVDQCNQMSKQVTGDSIPVLKPVPCLKLIEDVEEDESQKGDEKHSHLTNPQVDILPLPQLQKLLLTALPKTRVKILKIPFHATWRQSISDTATQ
ncbi:uncharacterized protein LOC105698850 isoform X2 [Orussus abietinus]|uniref:uncharacterized protein LOC105698850 isoform X2 n=1 Tax=Orussus abietinus TaxID=222816 RepID=UPI00062617DB|nr:uncharacterized protein LOC105698850 isoform X2 [Orussus abietinus]